MAHSPTQTVADLVARLGAVPLERIRLEPPPGKATEADVLEAERREGRLFELLDGVLVEKAMGYRESILALALAGYLRAHVGARNLGLVSGADGMVRLLHGLVRIPDVAFVAWDRIPGRQVPRSPLPDIVPNLAVEILSEGNTTGEIERKIREYFAAGVECVWLVDIRARTLRMHGPAGAPMLLGESETLLGDPVLPGFRLELSLLFGELDRIG